MSPPPPGNAVVRALTFVRFSHTVFALPFALGSMLVAAGGLPSAWVFGLILAAMVCARTAAMVFNRLADWEIDQRNPRTANRHRLMSRPAAAGLLVISVVGFVAAAAGLNPLCGMLSPVALVIIFFYSLTKRFTDYTQFFLGLALAVAPVGAWLAVRGQFAWPPLVLAAAVLLWVAGFDLIYATMDYEFDRANGLRSLVVRHGIPDSLRMARWLHGGALICFLIFGWIAGLNLIFQRIAFPCMGLALAYEHHVMRAPGPPDVGLVNRAFFNANAFVGLVFVLGVLGDVLMRR